MVNIDTSDMILKDSIIDNVRLRNKTLEEMWESPLRGLYWQEEIERKAAIMGGGNFVVPVQRVTDFLAGRSIHITNKTKHELSDNNSSNCNDIIEPSIIPSKIASSYRLG